MELLEKVLINDNLERAYKQVYANKGASGVDNVTVYELKDYMNKHMEEIKELIRNRKYNPSAVKQVGIPKENGDIRKLGIPTVIDRVIQQAIVQVLSPIYECQFSNYSYGFRPRRSCEMAVIKLLEYFNDGYMWIVDIDLEKFFDTVNHDKLIGIIMRTIHDGELVSLIRKYLVADVMKDGQLYKNDKGTPQGGNLSPLLSNILLNELDKELEKRGLNFVRYADDCIITVKSEKAANRVMEGITKFIEKKLMLKVNITKSKVARPNEIKYLGFGFYQRKGQEIWRPKPHIKSVEKFKRKLKQLTQRNKSILLKERVIQLNYLTRGWINYFRICDMKKVLQNITSHLCRRIRCIIWKQWKKIRPRIKGLMKLGATKQNAIRIAMSRKGYWNTSLFIGIYITNGKLKRKGLIFPIDYYLERHIEVVN